MQQARSAQMDPEAVAQGVLAHLSAGGEIVPAQLDDGITWSPERMLAAAVLVDALMYVREHHDKVGYQPEVTQDLAWIQSNDTEWPYAFVSLCHQLGLDPDFVRMVVRGWMCGSTQQDDSKQYGRRRGTNRKKTNARVLMIGRTTKTAVAGTGRRRVASAA